LGTRLRTWPQGYQGDYKTLESLYRGTPLSTGIGYYLDLYALRNPLAEGVRNRLKILENIVAKELQWRQKPHILNIACGSCRELMGLSPDIHKSKAKVVCIDDDSDALNFAMNRLSHTEAAKNISFRKYNAIRMFDHETNLREFGMQDIIYSVGLFDYLPDDFLSTLLKSLYMLLKKNGTFIIAFKDATYYDCTPHHWMADWDGFKQRKERDFTRILNNAQIPLKNLRIQKDATNIISFYLITRVD
jgi:SAM-dependent methyltransferase